MICLARQIKSIGPIIPFLTHRPIPTTIKWRAPIVQTAHSHWNSKTTPIGDTIPTRKKAIREQRRAKEKAEAKIPGTEAFVKAELKAQKLTKKEARKAQIAAGEPLTDEADIKAEEQARRDKEKLAKKQAEPVRRQARRDFKQDRREAARKTPEELREQEEGGLKIRQRVHYAGYKPRVYKTKEEYELERSKRGTKATVKTLDGPGTGYNSRDDKSWGSSPMGDVTRNFIGNHFDRNGGAARPAEASFSRSDRPQHDARDSASKRPWDSRGKGDENSASRPGRWQDPFEGRNERTSGRDSDHPATRPFSFASISPRRSDDHGDRSATPFVSRSRSDEQYVKREPWMVQKEAVKRKIGGEAWAPPKRLSPDTLEAIRTMHKSDPDKFSTPILAQQFKQSPEVIRRILRTKWEPNEEEVLDRQERWERRGEKIWTKQAELGVRPPKKWREMGVANTGEAGVAPRYKKNAHTRDNYGERPKHFSAQRRGASSDYDEARFKRPFSERIL